jgi:hypothetical protein
LARSTTLPSIRTTLSARSRSNNANAAEPGFDHQLRDAVMVAQVDEQQPPRSRLRCTQPRPGARPCPRPARRAEGAASVGTVGVHGNSGDTPRFRCVVPVTSFVEYTDTTPKVAHWFALGDDRPLFCFAGIWRPWSGIRGKEDGTHLLFAILTTDANELTKPIHAEAMPVMLTGDEIDTWLDGSTEEALALARPFRQIG